MKLPISYDVDITQPLFPVPLQSMLITADEYANQITVNLFQGKTPYSPGGTCAGFAVRKDGATVAITGTISGNALTITLPPAAYAIEGPINIGVKSIADGQKTTVFLGIGTVSNGESGVAVDPGTIIPSVTALIAAINDAVASIPQDYSELSSNVSMLQDVANILTAVPLNEFGYINSTGDVVEDDDYNCSGFIPILMGCRIVLDDFYNVPGSGVYTYAFYTSEKTFISGEEDSSSTPITSIPVSAAYVRFCSYTSGGQTPVAYVSNHVVADVADLKYRMGETEADVADLMPRMAAAEADVTDFKSALTAMETATAEDEGKALKAKTVSGGKVTEWEFGDAGSTVEIDDTLTQPGEAADAKATGERITALEEACFEKESNTYVNTSTNTASNGTWGFFLEDEEIESVTFTPEYDTGASGNVDVKRWITSNGQKVTNGASVTLVSTQSVAAGSSVTFQNLKNSEIITFESKSAAKLKYGSKNSVGSNETIAAQFCSISNNSASLLNNFYMSGTFVLLIQVEKIVNKYQGIAESGKTLIIDPNGYVVPGYADNPISGKKATLIGDSITEHNETALTCWAQNLANWNDITVQNLGQSGAGFAQYANKIAYIANDTNIIGVAASINDSDVGNIGTVDDTAADQTTLGYANTFFASLLTAFPTTPIICYVQCCGNNFTPINETAKLYIDGITTICEKLSIPFYGDMFYKGSVLRPWINANKEVYFKHDDPSGAHYNEMDMIHPNSLGHKVIAERLQGYFRKNIIR